MHEPDTTSRRTPCNHGSHALTLNFRTDDVNVRVLATILKFMPGGNQKQVVSMVISWWCNGFYQLNHHTNLTVSLTSANIYAKRNVFH